MDYKIKLQNNNRDLQSILNTINSLPDADSSSGTVVELPDAENFTFGTVTGAEYGITSENTYNHTTDKYTSWMSTYGYKFTANEDFSFAGFRFMVGYSYSAKLDLWDAETQTQIATLTVTPTVLNEWVEYRLESPINLEAGKTYMVSQYCQARSYQSAAEVRTYCQKISVDGIYYISDYGYPSKKDTGGYAIDILIQPPITETVITEYKIQLKTMTEIADEIRRISEVSGSVTTAQIITALQGIETGGGGLPENVGYFYKATANSELVLNFETSAIGELQEG